MPVVTLTDRFVSSARAPEGRPQEDFRDSKTAGLTLRVSATGRKAWTFLYRDVLGRERRVTLGTYPAFKLADARSEAIGLKARVEKGGSPADEKRRSRHAAQRSALNTVGAVAEDYIELRRSRLSARYVAELCHLLKLHIKPRFGDIPADQLTRPEVRAFIREIGERGTIGRATAIQAFLSGMMNWAVKEERIAINPLAGLERLYDASSRERVLTDDELKGFWGALDAAAAMVAPLTSLAIRFAALTLQRRGEVIEAKVEEFDLKAGVWTIPKERTKNRRTHFVPLSTQALQVLRDALEHPSRIGRGGRNELVFPSPNTGLAIRRDALSQAAQRGLGAAGVKDGRLHDLRRTGATWLCSEDGGFSRFIVSQVLNHTGDRGGGAAVTGVYDRYSYMPEKRAALTRWGDHVAELVGLPLSSAQNVVVRLRSGAETS